jgi:hypothetical protein
MKILGSVAILSLLLAQASGAEPWWAQLSLSTSAANAPKVVAAADAFMSSEVGKTFPGRLLLQANVADGSNPATHTFVPIYKSAADREAFVQSLQGNAAWAQFQAALADLGEPGGQVLYRNLARWGDINDTDDVWMAHAFQVEDPAAFAAAVDAFLKSPTGQKFPGQVYLSAVVAGGMTPVTHVISVGYDSVLEMAEWLPVRNGSSDWATYQPASDEVSTYLGGSLASDVKSWGPATMKDIAGQP